MILENIIKAVTFISVCSQTKKDCGTEIVSKEVRAENV